MKKKGRRQKKLNKKKKIISFKEGDIEKYKIKLEDLENEKDWNKIREKITRALKWKIMKDQGKGNDEKWFNKECKEEKRRLKKTVEKGKKEEA